jgi:1,4-alpha-glucan branching enzyme
VGVPVGGLWRELLNSDSDTYAGSNMGNGGLVWAGDEPWNGRPHSVQLTLPPLGMLFLKPA